MKIKTFLFIVISCLVIASFLAVGEGMARVNTPPGIGVGLTIDGSATRIPGKLAFYETDPIPIVLTLENVCGDLTTAQVFSGKPCHLYLKFTGPAAKGILADERESTLPTEVHVPPPKALPVGSDLKQVEAVEILPGSGTAGGPWSLEITIPNAYTFYTLFLNAPSPAGRYSVKAVIPMRKYSQVDYTVDLVDYSLLTSVAFQETVSSDPVYFSIIADFDLDGYFYPDDPSGTPDCDDRNAAVRPGVSEVVNDGIDNDCDPNTPDVSPVLKGTISIHADRYAVGTGSYPPAIKESLSGMPVKVMDMSPTSCVARHGFTWPNYYYIYNECSPVQFGRTDANGDEQFIVPPGDYAVLGYYDPNQAVKNDEIYISGTVNLPRDNMTVLLDLKSIVNPAGKNVPARSTRRTGSELVIIEPEYIEWTGTEEFYPFVFRSVGDWNVTTTIAPPEGFVADADALEAEVNSDLKAVQFVVTDVGSEWKDTKVKHKVKHRAKTEIIKSKIGVKNMQEKKKKK